MSFERKLIYKIYQEDGSTLVETVNDVVSDLTIKKQVNGGDSEFVFELDRKMDDFDEDTSIKFNNRVKVYVKDEYNTLGDKLVANGYIVSYKPFLAGKKEGVIVTCLSAISKLSNDFYRLGTFADATSSADPANLAKELTNKRVDEMMEDIIDHYRLVESNSMISNDYSNVSQTTDNSGSLFAFDHRFFNMKHLDAIREVTKFLPRNKVGGYWFYWRINTAGLLYLKNISSTADHTFHISKHITEISGRKTIEDVVNRVYFYNEKGTADPDYIQLTADDSTSQGNYDIIAEYITDSKVTYPSAASLLSSSKVYDRKDPKVRVEVVLNGNYDLAGIEPGDTCKILNIKNNPFKIGSDDILVIHSLEYSVDSVKLILAEANDRFEDIIEAERQRLDKEMTWFGFITQQLTAAQLGPANRTWNSDITFSATAGSDAYRQVEWTAGTVYLPTSEGGTAGKRIIDAGDTTAILGGFMSSATDYFIYIDEVTFNTSASNSDTGAAGIIKQGGDALYDSGKSWSTDQYKGYLVTIGGQTKIIKSNTATVLTIEDRWTIADTTGAYTIKKMTFDVTSNKETAAALARIVFSNVRVNANTDSEAVIIPVRDSNINIDGGTQIAEFSITNAKIIDLEVDKLTAGTITSQAITLAVDPGSGDSYIAAGKTDFTNIDTGFILGIDDSDADTPKFYIGDNTSYLNWTGSALEIAGNISAGTIDIGGADASSFHVDVDGNMWLGAATFNLSTNPFAVSNAGVIRAVSGTIGGNTLGSDFISSSSFVSGPLGSGWKIENSGTAELQDVTIRGTIRTSVFEKDTISAVNGLVLVSSADVLDSAMTSSDSATVTISGETTFSVDEVIRIKDGTDDEYMLVTNAASAPTYTVTRDLAAAYAADTNPAWTKGTAVVSQGVGSGTKTGYVLLDSSSTNSPYIDIYGRNSTTYNDVTNHARIGWLKGITDADVGLSSTDVWGIYTDNAYIKGAVVATSGKIGTTTDYWSIGATGITAVAASTDVIINYGKTDFGQDATAGFIIGYDYSASKSKLEIGSDADNLLKFDGTNLSLTGGTITGGTYQTSSTVPMFKITDATTRFEGINANGDVIGFFDWESTGATTPILRLDPEYNARRCLEILIPASFAGGGAESSANAILIENFADSVSIDIVDGGIVGLEIGPTDNYGINITGQAGISSIHISGGSTTGPCLDFDFTSSVYPVIEIAQEGTNTNSYGIRITQGTAALKEGIYIDDNANSHLSESIYIDRDSNSASNAAAMKIDSTNAGSGKSIGIDFSGMPNAGSKGHIFKMPADGGSIGSYIGRIGILVGSTTRYIPYYA